jgi:parallel beta-helix repeat protein
MGRLYLRPHPATVAIGAVIFALAGAAFLALDRGDQALASHVGCGDKITTDTRLDSDLIDCRNNGVVIGADGVTLNLNGHTIDGDGKPFAACPRRKICDNGVLSIGHDGVTVVGGSVREFDVGVGVGNARRARLLGITSSENRFLGVLIFNSARSLVRDSSILGTGLGSGASGLVLSRSHNNRIAHNTLSGNGDFGLFLDLSDHNHISFNTVRRNPNAGIDVEGDRNQIVGNRLIRNGGGILLTRHAVGNSVSRNYVRDSRAYGMAVDPGPKIARTLLSRNHVFGAGTTGIKVGSPSTTLTRNEARRNGKLGINAVPGVIDGGGNRASGNGDPRQCVNVACK